jgi:hypothetical protein
MGLKNLADEYSKLMGRNPEGTYLYTPQKFEAFHPGSLGYFDENGTWNMITDLCLPERTQRDGFKDMSHPLKWEKPETAAWRTRSSDSETEQSLDANAEISGALSSAPVDVGGKAKTKRGSTMKAELVTGSVVKHERLKAPFNSIIQSWIKNNAKELVQGIHGVDVRKYGVWAIRAVYVTPECAITMDSGKNSEISLGATVGATGIGKLGTEGSTLAKLKNAGWTTYSEEEVRTHEHFRAGSESMIADTVQSEQGYVVAFSGSKFALRPFSALRSNVSIPSSTLEHLQLSEKSPSTRLSAFPGRTESRRDRCWMKMGMLWGPNVFGLSWTKPATLSAKRRLMRKPKEKRKKKNSKRTKKKQRDKSWKTITTMSSTLSATHSELVSKISRRKNKPKGWPKRPK